MIPLSSLFFIFNEGKRALRFWGDARANHVAAARKATLFCASHVQNHSFCERASRVTIVRVMGVCPNNSPQPHPLQQLSVASFYRLAGVRRF